ncbi:hypothetical protein [Hallella sp.]|uniref:hypothetical protein n=1 Tax=Hallella sp. TaxID=2980186 RepID=UPI0030807C1C
MKRIFLLLATIGSMFLTACSTQDDTSHLEIKSSASTFENPYLFIGQLHNEAMDSVKAQNVSIGNIKEFTKEFTNRHYHQVSNYSEETPVEKVEIDSTFRSIDNGFDIGMKTRLAKTRATVDHLTDSLIMAFPVEGKKYIERIYDVCDREMYDTVQINIIFDDLDNSIHEDINIDDTLRHTLLAISSIGRATNIYNAHANTNKTRGASAGSVCRADVSGAISGIFGRAAFVRAAFSGFVFGPGGVVTSFARDAVRGAIVGSAVNLISGGKF